MKPIPVYEMNALDFNEVLKYNIKPQEVEIKKDTAWLGILLIIAITSTVILVTIKNKSDERK
jgi:hypothetical protein